MSKSGGDIWKRKQNIPLKQCSKRFEHLHTSGLKTCTPISHNPVFHLLGISWVASLAGYFEEECIDTSVKQWRKISNFLW